jgi:ribonucleoside-diphosphate reductase alpha chain
MAADQDYEGDSRTETEEFSDIEPGGEESGGELNCDIIQSEIRLSRNALEVLKRRYLKKDEDGVVIETPEQMFRRVAHHVAMADLLYEPECDVEATEEKFFRIMANCEFLPNSPTMMNAGRTLGQLSGCFVIPIEDSMESIFEAIKSAALVQKSGGGTGFSFTRIRPKCDRVKSTKGISSGPLSFLNVFDAATETVKQGGTRRGANMAVMRVDHPDIVDFITAKKDDTRLTNFNTSVAVTDEFMKKVESDEDYDLVNPYSNKVVKRLKARKVFDLMVTMAWKNGDPGIIFLDRINNDNPTPHIGEIESTNPCGEQPLLPYESCNLGSINLAKMIKRENGDAMIDWDKLKDTVCTAVKFLDNVIDINKYPLEIIERMTRGNRKIGLGIMGFADMLILLGIPYNSEDAIKVGGDVMRFVTETARMTSRELSHKRGAFPNFRNSVYDLREEPEIRNATCTTIAPTGTLSIIAGCSSGIEPLFALSYVRHVMDDDRLVEVHPIFEAEAKRHGFYSEELMERLSKGESLQKMVGIPQEVKDLFVTAHDIAPEWHIRMQGAFQRFTDNAVSKTVNFPHDASADDVRDVYTMAYKLACKGVTIYRDRSRDKQVLNVGEGIDGKQEISGQIVKRDRPKMLTGHSTEMQTGCGPLYVTINEDDHGLFELFNTMGKAGGCAASQNEAIGRLVSLAWRSGIGADSIIKQLIGIRCHKPYGLGKEAILSCSDAIAKAVQLCLNHDQSKDDFFAGAGACPECGASMEHEGGCSFCRSCAYSECM